MPQEQHDDANDGLSYKKILTRRLSPDPAIIPPPQGKPVQNPVQNPVTNPATTPAQKLSNLPLPDSLLIKSINQQLRAVKEAQELQESRSKAHEETLAESAGVRAASMKQITDMQQHKIKNKEIFDKLALQMNSQAKILDTMQTDIQLN